jgi:hypothetical protein
MKRPDVPVMENSFRAGILIQVSARKRMNLRVKEV